MTLTFRRDDLLNLRPRHDFLACVDSDGCVFDTMEIKQKQCFHPLIISHWHLEPIEALVRETASFVNLYSRSRGRNRFLSLRDMFDFLNKRPEVMRSGIAIPDMSDLTRFIESGAPLDHAHLEREAATTGSMDLANVLKWSHAVNARIEQSAPHIPAFEWARRSLCRMRETSDVVVVSQTPEAALVREWSRAGLFTKVAVIAGQELGTKAEHIGMATRDNRYRPDHTIMIGDAPGDLDAAMQTGSCFYPIEPGAEEASWQRFTEEAYERFLAGTYVGSYQDVRIASFLDMLPETPPWLLKHRPATT